jgi:hypothetical protein
LGGKGSLLIEYQKRGILSDRSVVCGGPSCWCNLCSVQRAQYQLKARKAGKARKGSSMSKEFTCHAQY